MKIVIIFFLLAIILIAAIFQRSKASAYEGAMAIIQNQSLSETSLPYPVQDQSLNLNKAYVQYFNRYPYFSYRTASIINDGAYVEKGFILFSNVDATDLSLKPWGGKENKLAINNIQKYNSSLYKIEGAVGSTAAGFVVEGLNYTGRYLSIIVGDVIKSHEAQLTFALNVKGSNIDYQLIFVQGPLSIKGWHENKYYEHIDPHSSRLIDLDDLLLSRTTNYIVDKITITLQKETEIYGEFRIDLGKSTLNTPILLTADQTYFVMGDLAQPPERIISNHTIYNNLGFIRSIEFEFPLRSDNYTINQNGWVVIDNKTVQGNEIGFSKVLVSAEQRIPETEHAFDIIYTLDLSESLTRLGSKDWLLLSVFVASFLIYPFKRLFR